MHLLWHLDIVVIAWWRTGRVMNRTNPGGKNPIHASAKVGAAITALKVCHIYREAASVKEWDLQICTKGLLGLLKGRLCQTQDLMQLCATSLCTEVLLLKLYNSTLHCNLALIFCMDCRDANWGMDAPLLALKLCTECLHWNFEHWSFTLIFNIKCGNTLRCDLIIIFWQLDTALVA